MDKNEYELRLRKAEQENLMLRKLLANSTSSCFADPNPIPFSQTYETWLKAKSMDIAVNTYQEYLRMYDTTIKPYFDGMALQDIDADTVEKFYRHLASHGKKSATIIRYHSNLKTFAKYAFMNSILGYDFMAKVSRPKSKGRYFYAVYTIEEIIELLRLTKNDKIYTPILISAVFGLRRSEVLGLRWESIDFKSKTITIRTKVMRDKHNKKDMATNSLKTSSSYRTLAIPDFILPYLKQKRQLISALKYKDECEYVCIDEDGKRLTLNQISNRFRKLLQKHGLPKIRFHDLRHSCATILLHSGSSLKDIQDWLGHSNYQTTANIYLHTCMNDKIKIAENLNGLFLDTIMP